MRRLGFLLGYPPLETDTGAEAIKGFKWGLSMVESSYW